jgi:hypothetical protein
MSRKLSFNIHPVGSKHVMKPRTGYLSGKRHPNYKVFETEGLNPCGLPYYKDQCKYVGCDKIVTCSKH